MTPYIYKTNPESFKIHNLKATKKLHGPDIRITLDTQEDYVLLCAVYDFLYDQNPFFNGEDLVTLFYNKPWLKSINEKVSQKKIFHHLEEELEEAVKVLDLQDLKKAKDFVKQKMTEMVSHS